MKLKGGGAKKKTTPMDNAGDSDAASLDVNRDIRGEPEENLNDKEEEEVVVEPEPEPEAEAEVVVEAEEAEEEDEEEEEEEEEEEAQETQEERPKLGDDFYEIEAIRRRRVRKGQLQYLIKWRGWPETDNTWEPLENLQSCSDVLDAFEESLRSGKSSRKRKRRSGGSLSLSKKKQMRSSHTAYNVAGGQTSSSALMNTGLLNFSAGTQLAGSVREGQSNGDGNNVKTAKQINENRLANGSKQIDGRQEETDYDPKLSELKGAVSSNEVNADKLAIHFQESKASEGNGVTHSRVVDCVAPVQSDRRTGSRRRKSGSVKRFKQDLAASKPVGEPNSSPSFAFGCSNSAGQLVMGDSSYMNKIDGSRNPSAFVKILKAINFSASVTDNVQDVVVTFVALRSDGREVMVDNKFLKANDPLLLINFYEQNLKYNAP